MKPYQNISIGFAFALFNLLFIWGSSGSGYGDENKACNTLSGIETIDIVFDWDGQGMPTSEYSHTKDILQAFVVQKLREDGVKIHEIFSCEKIDTIKNKAFLYVEMHTYKASEDEHTVYIDAKYFQEVSLKDDPTQSFISPTWSAGGTIHIAPVASFPDILSGMLAKFVSAYKSVNQQVVVEYENSDRKVDPEGGM